MSSQYIPKVIPIILAPNVSAALDIFDRSRRGLQIGESPQGSMTTPSPGAGYRSQVPSLRKSFQDSQMLPKGLLRREG